MSFLTERLNSSHNREDFFCGKESLDNYLKSQATQDVKRKLSACFVMTTHESNLITGYYTLSNNSVALNLIPSIMRDKLPQSYKNIPATLLGRLAVSIDYQRQGAGRLLLFDALSRCYSTSKIIGSFAVIVDPLDKEAVDFYEKYGFIKLPDNGKMFLPMKTIEQLFF